MYKFNENLIAMKIGERSVYYATQHGISFTETEYQAIMNFDKDLTDKQAMWFSEPMSIILRTANDLAMLDDKNTKTD